MSGTQCPMNNVEKCKCCLAGAAGRGRLTRSKQEAARKSLRMSPQSRAVCSLSQQLQGAERLASAAASLMATVITDAKLQGGLRKQVGEKG